MTSSARGILRSCSGGISIINADAVKVSPFDVILAPLSTNRSGDPDGSIVTRGNNTSEVLSALIACFSVVLSVLAIAHSKSKVISTYNLSVFGTGTKRGVFCGLNLHVSVVPVIGCAQSKVSAPWLTVVLKNVSKVTRCAVVIKKRKV